MQSNALVSALVLAPAMAGVAAAPSAYGAGVAELLVEDSRLAEPSWSEHAADRISAGPTADGGELLRELTGVGGSRMGGHGIEPLIRGQSQTRLNILLDGAYLHGGCPNRMDPPTAYSGAETYDEVSIIKGSQTVRYGGGGSGGTVLFERVTPRFTEHDPLRGTVGAGHRGNADLRQLSADLASGTPTGFVRGILEYKDAGSYRDGDGDTVRSAFTQRGGTVIAGYTPDAATRVELSAEATRERDALFAGAGMDSPYSDSDNLRLKLRRRAAVGPFAGIEGTLYQTRVNHLMDNYSLRPNTGPRARVPTDSDTTGARISVDLEQGEWLWTIGVDVQSNSRDADKFTGGPAGEPGTLQSIIWPDADLDQTGVFAELDMPVTLDDSVELGLRYDYVDASIGRGDEGTAMATPNQLYSRFYSETATRSREHNVGGFVRWERALAGGNGQVTAAISRSVRTADATERYAANFMGPMGIGSWVGNNALDPEAHHQAELGLNRHASQWRLRTAIHFDKVDDFILRDRDTGQNGIATGNGTATIYRNVGATLYGVELEGEYRIAPNWSLDLGLAYVHAENDADDRPIAQIPPLEATLGLRYRRGDWDLGGRVRANAKQTRADLDEGSGQDLEETSGWAVLDLDGRFRPNEDLTLRFGVENLLDQTYAYHVNRDDVFNPIATPINEPGRSVWLRGEVRF